MGGVCGACARGRRIAQRTATSRPCATRRLRSGSRRARVSRRADPNRFLDLQGSAARKWKEGRSNHNTPISQYSRAAAPEDTSQVRHDDVSTAQRPCGGGQYALPADATACGGAIRRNEGPTTVKKILRNWTSSPRKNREKFRPAGRAELHFRLMCRKNAVGASVLCIVSRLRKMKGRTMHL